MAGDTRPSLRSYRALPKTRVSFYLYGKGMGMEHSLLFWLSVSSIVYAVAKGGLLLTENAARSDFVSKSTAVRLTRGGS